MAAFDKYTALITKMFEEFADHQEVRLREVDGPITAWALGTQVGGTAAVTVDQRDDGSATFSVLGFVGTGIDDAPGVFRGLTGFASTSMSGVMSIENWHGPSYVVAFCSRISNALLDSNPPEGIAHLFFAAASLADHGVAASRVIFPLVSDPRLVQFEVGDVEHALSCQLIERLKWTHQGELW